MEPSKKYNILLIDSNQVSIEYLQNILNNSVYNLVNVEDSDTAFTMLSNNTDQFSVVILGQNIENSSAIRLLHQINSNSHLKIIPIIMEAYYGTIEEMEICIRAGARYILPKPIDKNMFLNLIQIAIRDQERYQYFESSVWETKPLNTLVDATFKIKKLYEAQILASLLANECPNPRLAIIGISEILINAIEHGNLGITYAEKTKLTQHADWVAEVEHRLSLPENDNKLVTVKFNKSQRHVNIRITDSGDGFDWRKYQELDSKRVMDNHGRGIIMARSLAFENMIYHGIGNDVECIIPLAT